MGGPCACTSRKSLRGPRFARGDAGRVGVSDEGTRDARGSHVRSVVSTTRPGERPVGRVGFSRAMAETRLGRDERRAREPSRGGARGARKERHAPRDMVLRLEVDVPRGETRQEERACAPLLCRVPASSRRCANFPQRFIASSRLTDCRPVRSPSFDADEPDDVFPAPRPTLPTP